MPFPIVDMTVTETLQAAAAATGNGTAITMKGYPGLTIEITGTFVGTVTFEGTIDDSSFFVVGLKTVADGAAVTTATAPGAWKLPIDGPVLSQFRGRVSAYTSGAITVKSCKGMR
jgi:hypothetical protein